MNFRHVSKNYPNIQITNELKKKISEVSLNFELSENESTIYRYYKYLLDSAKLLFREKCIMLSSTYIKEVNGRKK